MQIIDNKSIIIRLETFCNYKKISLSQLERESLLNDGVLRGAKSKNSALGYDKIVNILTTYPEINTDWLMMGRGEMLKDMSLENTDEIETLKKSLIEKDQRIEELKSHIETLNELIKVIKG